MLGEALDAPPEGARAGVTPVAPLDRRARAVSLVPVGLDDQAPVGPHEVDLDVQLGQPDVDARAGEVRVGADGEHGVLDVASGYRVLVARDRCPDRWRSEPAVAAGQELVDGNEVEDPERFRS